MAAEGETPVLKLRPRRSFVSLRKSASKQMGDFSAKSDLMMPPGKSLPSFISKGKSSPLSLRLSNSKKRSHVTIGKKDSTQVAQSLKNLPKGEEPIASFKPEIAKEIPNKNSEIKEKPAFRPFQFSNPESEPSSTKNVEVTEKLQFNPLKKNPEPSDASVLSTPAIEIPNKNREVTEKLQFNPLKPSPGFLQEVSKPISPSDNTEVLGKVNYKAVEKLTSTPPPPPPSSNKIKVVSPGFRSSDPTNILEKPSIPPPEISTLSQSSLVEPPPPNKNREVTEKLVFKPFATMGTPVPPSETKTTVNTVKPAENVIPISPVRKPTNVLPPPPPPVLKRDTDSLKLPPDTKIQYKPSIPLSTPANLVAEAAVPGPKPLPLDLSAQKAVPIQEGSTVPKRTTTAVPTAPTISPAATFRPPIGVGGSAISAASLSGDTPFIATKEAIPQSENVKPRSSIKMFALIIVVLSWLTAAYLMASFIGRI